MSSSNQQPPVTIRLATLADTAHIGLIAADTYRHTALSHFLSPRLDTHYSHYVRGFTQRARKRQLDARNLTFVAVDETLGVPIGHLQCERVGTDEGAKRQLGSWARRAALSVAATAYEIWCALVGVVVGGDKSGDAEPARLFGKWGEEQDKVFWEGIAERVNRWHVQSFVVRKEYQGKGVGKSLMREVLRRAQEENVVVGVEASEEGEGMYRKQGFELLGRFKHEPYEELLGTGGGIMMWTPEGWKGSNEET